MRLRQVALVAADLAAAEREVSEALGLDLCFRDPGVGEFGLHNALFPIGELLLEIVSPLHDGTTAGRLLERRRGDGGYMVLVQVRDLEPYRVQLEGAGTRVIHEAHGDGITGIHVHPKDIGGAIVSIDQAEPWDSWGWAGEHRSWRNHIRTGVVSHIAAVEIQATDPEAMAARWAAVLDQRIGPSGSELMLDEGGSVRFVEDTDGRGEGVSAVDVVAGDSSRVGDVLTVVGTRFNFVSA